MSTYATSFDPLQIIKDLVQNGYAIVDNVLSNQEDLRVLSAEAAHASAPEAQLLTKTEQSADIRRDLTHDVDPLDDEKLPCLAKASRTLQFTLGGAVDLFLPQPLYCRERPQFASYASSGFYTRHFDNPRLLGGSDNLRRLTILLYLNEGQWDDANGGQLRLHVKNNDKYDVTIAPQSNRAVVFFSDLIEHEVLPCFTHRVALTVWLSELLPDPASGLANTIHRNDQLMRDFFVQCCQKVSHQSKQHT